MTLTVCIPCYRNLPCLRLAVAGLAKFAKPIVSQVLLHIQEPTESMQTVECFTPPFATHIVSHGGATENMSDILNRLAAQATGDWVLFTEQDCFLTQHVETVIRQMEERGQVVGGPIDTMHACNPNAQRHQLYGQFMRLCTEPGYFHSSLILIKGDVLRGTKDPFTVRNKPPFTELRGYVFGGETYYGLRDNIGVPKEQMAFFDQHHGGYGYCAGIYWAGWRLATHLFFSGTKQGYRDSGFLSEAEHIWLIEEEQRFLKDYEATL